MKPLLSSFAGGEIIPELHARLGLVKRQTGLALTENVRIQPAGPVEKRQGTRFITPPQTTASALIPVVFGDSASYVLELHSTHIGFYALGAAVLNATALAFTSVTQGATTSAVLGSPTVSETLVYFDVVSNPTHPLHRKYWLYNHTAGTLKTPHGDPVDSSAWPALSWNGGTDRVYQRLVLASAGITLSGDLRQTRVAVRDNLITLVHPSWTRVLRLMFQGGTTPFLLYAVSFQPNIDGLSGGGLTISAGGGGTPVTVKYQVCPLTDDGLEEGVVATTLSVNVDLTVATVSIGLPSTTLRRNDNTSIGGVSYLANIYKLRGGVAGFIGQEIAGGTFVDNNIEPDMSRNPPFHPKAPGSYFTTNVTLSANAVAYWNQREWFGAPGDETGGARYPQSVVATRPGTDRNLTRRQVTADDDAIYTTLVSKVGTTIRHLVSLDELVALTSNSIVRVGNGQEPATPSIGSRAVANVGASHVPPAETAGSVLFVGAADQHVWELRYTNEGGGYRAQDISLFSTHLFDGFTIVQLAFAKGRIPTVYALREDGVLLAATYVPEQEILAWHRVMTDAVVKSVCVIPEGGVDVAYLIVARTLNGQTRYCVEQVQNTTWTDRADAYFVDCGLSYEGTPVGTVSGLWHLEGESVKVVADGAVYDAAVSGGEVDLVEDASVVHVGLGYRARVQTLPMILEAPSPAGGTASVQLGSHAWVSVKDSLGVKYGTTFDRLTEIPVRELEAMGSPPELQTGVHEVILEDEWDYETSLCFESDEPLPFTLRGIGVNVVSEEEQKA